MWFISNRYKVLFCVILTASYDILKCNAISNTSNFNSHLRDYTTDDNNNITDVKTLQKEELGRYTNFAPASNPIKFKEIPDSALSGTSSGRGLYHDQPGYTLHDYEEDPHYSYGHEYHLHEDHPDVHGHHGYEYDHHDHHAPHDYDHHHFGGHHHLDHGHYNKHFKHALAAKTILWPLAGIALLGAAALVSNPVLLQLGVISGKRRRRNTEEVTGPDFPEKITKYEEKIKRRYKDDEISKFKRNNITNQMKDSEFNSGTDNFNKRVLKIDSHQENKGGLRKIRSSVKRNMDQITRYYSKYYSSNNDDDRFIPIPIKIRSPKDLD